MPWPCKAALATAILSVLPSACRPHTVADSAAERGTHCSGGARPSGTAVPLRPEQARQLWLQWLPGRNRGRGGLGCGGSWRIIDLELDALPGWSVWRWWSKERHPTSCGGMQVQGLPSAQPGLVSFLVVEGDETVFVCVARGPRRPSIGQAKMAPRVPGRCPAAAPGRVLRRPVTLTELEQAQLPRPSAPTVV